MRCPELSSLVAACGLLLAARTALGEQFTLFEGTFVHTVSSKAFSYPRMSEGVPSNWVSPVNYAEGKAYAEYELRSMASDRPISYQWCLFQGGSNHTCCRCVKFAKPGLYTMEEQVDRMWANFKVDFTRPFDKFMLVVKDERGNPVDDRYGFGGGWAGSPDFSLYYPFEVRVKVVIVSKGATYNPYWETGGVRVSDLVHLSAAAAALQLGELGKALAIAEGELASTDAARAAEARRLAEALRSYARERTAQLAAMKQADPAYAIKSLAELARRFAPSGLAKELLAEAAAWQKDPAVAREMSARTLLEVVERSASRIRTKGTAADPKFAQRYAVELQTIAACAMRLRREYPGTSSAARAGEIAKGLGLALPEN